MDDTPPTETPRDVVEALIDAYRDVQLELLIWLRTNGLKRYAVTQRTKRIDADCEGWRTRYAAAVARRLATAPGE